MDLLAKYDAWVDFVRDLVTRDLEFFPRAAVGDLLDRTIESAAVSWNWASPGGTFGCEFNGPVSSSGWSLTDVPTDVACRMQRSHPLLQWFRASGDPQPMSVGRVPRGIASERDFASLREVLEPGGVEEQLSIPYRLAGGEHRAFVLARGGEDFPDEDVELARRIQPLLALLDRQVTAAADRRRAGVSVAMAAAGLTGREVAVLALLSGGGTAESIGRRLMISTRTVHAHLQHVYRKLGVDDRMRAVLVAQELGLLDRRAAEAAWAGPCSSAVGHPAARPPRDAVDGEPLDPHGHRWMILLDDVDAAWAPPPSGAFLWARRPAPPLVDVDTQDPDARGSVVWSGGRPAPR
jgi:DNA-binding CsgD family transcriptional regulator